MAKAQGKEFTFDSEDHINPDFLETFPFDSKKQYETMFGFMEEFFEIIEDDSKFKKLILDQARTK